MPLRRSSAPAAIGQNIQTEESAGKPPQQATAIALNTARRAGAAIPAKPARRPLRPPFGK